MMTTKKAGPGRVRVTLSITKEAQDIIFDNGYASQRGMGAFISALIVAYHERRTPAVADELRRLADVLDAKSK